MESYFLQLEKWKSNMLTHSSSGLVSTNSWIKSVSSCNMFCFHHKVVANFVCRLLGTRHVLCHLFIRTLSLKQLPAAAGNEIDESGETEQAADLQDVKSKQWAERWNTPQTWGRLESGDNLQWISHNQQPPVTLHLTHSNNLIIFYIKKLQYFDH